MLEEAFTQAKFVLAQHHYQKALQYEANEDFEKMAYAVDGAARHLLYAPFWTDNDLEDDKVVAIKEGCSLARKQIQGATWSDKKISQAEKSIACGIQSPSKKIKPLKGEPEE